jgi:hypothetical protein
MQNQTYPGLTKLALAAAPQGTNAAVWAADAVADMEDYLGDCTGQGDVLCTPAQLAALDAALVAHPDMYGVWAGNAQALAALPAGVLGTLGHVLDAL